MRDFAATRADDVFYDLVFDRALIEASFAAQYGLRLVKEDMAFGEFCRLLGGLMADTPLGRVVAVRAEKNPERIRNFGESEHRLRREWRGFLRSVAVRDECDELGDIERLKRSLEAAFGVKEV